MPPGQAVQVAGYRLSGGMVYVGRSLASLGESWRQETEPALIQPYLRVVRSNPDHSGNAVGYWPSYGELSPEARAGYLDWLAGGRRNPSAYIGFVFLFFYGLERRVLSDAQHSKAAWDEMETLLKEVEELLAVYGDQPSFRRYATSFLDVGRLLRHSVPLETLEPPTPTGESWELSLRTKLALGAYAQQGEPIPVKWALAWLFEAQVFRLRTPAQRCREEFRRLFELRYPTHFRDGGLRIKPNKTRLSARYRAASSSFAHRAVEFTVPDLPDVTVLTAPVRRLQGLVDQVTQELDAYSRWVGRKDDRTSPAALALLPAELAVEQASPEGEAFIEGARNILGDNEAVVVEKTRLVEGWPSASSTFPQKESALLATFLENYGLGIEPDCRFGGPALGKVENVVLFRSKGVLPEQAAAGQKGDPYAEAALLVHLAAAVAAADGAIAPNEERQLMDYIEKAQGLSEPGRDRLRHNARWLLLEPPRMAGLKARIAGLGEADRHAAARFLLAIAAADGRVDPEEIRMLRRMYVLLGLDADAVISDAHALMAGDSPAQDPVTILKAQRSQGVAIPRVAANGATVIQGFELDAEKILATRRASDRISGVLAGIFEEPEPEASGEPAAESSDSPGESVKPTICGLDAAHSAFLLRLAERSSWEQAAVQRLAETCGVLPEGALEMINDAAIEAVGEPLLEWGEPITIDEEIFQEMIA